MRDVMGGIRVGCDGGHSWDVMGGIHVGCDGGHSCGM